MSTIYKIAENLKNTIAGKEKYLAEIENINAMKITSGEAMALAATSKFLKININELKVILFDVEKACEEYSLQGWQINPERMGQ